MAAGPETLAGARPARHDFGEYRSRLLRRHPPVQTAAVEAAVTRSTGADFIARPLVGATFGRDAALASRKLRYRPQSRASSLPLSSAQDRARDLYGRPPLLPTAPRAGARHMSPLLSGSEDPSHKNPLAGNGSGAFPVGAALAATRRWQVAGSGAGCYREQARSHKASRAPIPAASAAPSPPQIGDESAQA